MWLGMHIPCLSAQGCSSQLQEEHWGHRFLSLHKPALLATPTHNIDTHPHKKHQDTVRV